MLPPMQAQASTPSPYIPKFSYGARLDPLGLEVNLAINTAAAIGLDWLGLDFDWAQLWPKENAGPDLRSIDIVMRKSSDHELKILLSITNPPTWALTSQGPDVDKTIQLVKLLSSRYPNYLLAIELFPGANTMKGWGAEPNPLAYKSLLEASWKALHAAGSPVWLVAGGLRTRSAEHSRQDIDDLTFLKALYEAKAAAYMPIVSIRLEVLNNDVMAHPDSAEQHVLRHYEEVREIMRQYEHSQASIWVTGFEWPAQPAYTVSSQSKWIRQAYCLMRSQLYIGAAFFDQLNPSHQFQQQAEQPLIRIVNGRSWLHPAASTLGEMITQDRTGQFNSSTWAPYLKLPIDMSQIPTIP